MYRKVSVELEQILLEYDPVDLARWRKGDPNYVPSHVLSWKGPGRENGYGFGEYIVEKHLISQGYKVITNQYNLFAYKKSKYKENNLKIREAMGEDKFARLKKMLFILKENGIKVEQPDICTLEPSLFFAEVKRDKDYLRTPQGIFAILVSNILDIPFTVYKLLPIGTKKDIKPIVFSGEIPINCFDV